MMKKDQSKELGKIAAEYALDMAQRLADAGQAVALKTHPLTGLFCHKTSADPELTKYGWNFDYQCCVHSVIGDVAMLQFFSILDGCPTTIEPRPLAELLNGDWRFYPTVEAWAHAGIEASDRYFKGHEATRRPKLATA